MRLRQIALASLDLDAATHALSEVFGLKVAYNDPGIHHYGLKNAVLPAGTAFLEVVEPIADTASAGRFLARRGGDAGYMIIIQAPDAEAERARVVSLGVRVVDDIDSPAYRASHFHPADFGGMLVSIDQQRTAPDYLEPYGDWWPAGKDWREFRSGTVLDLVGVTLSAADPAALAALWSKLLDTPLDDTTDPPRLKLTRGEIRFCQGPDALTWISRIDLKVADVDGVLDAAAADGLDIDDGAVLIGGVRFRPVP
jgi:catechol 2,3-dioxygenase-like lactoylglutathione lyase family enzyme